MTAPEHLTISGPEDILGYIPHSLGYWPSDSLVAMTMQGKRLGATLRVDLPVSESSREREDFARNVAGYLLKPVTFSNFCEVMTTLNKYWALVELP